MQTANPMRMRPMPGSRFQNPAPQENVAPFRHSAVLVRLPDASIKVDIDAHPSTNQLPDLTGTQPL